MSYCRRSKEAEVKAEVAEERKETILLMNTYPTRVNVSVPNVKLMSLTPDLSFSTALHSFNIPAKLLEIFWVFVNGKGMLEEGVIRPVIRTELSSIDEFKLASIDKASTLQHLLNLILADFYTHSPCTPCSANVVNSKEQQLGLCAIQKIDPRWTKGASIRQHSDDNRSYLEQPDYVVHS
ncbi:hypothetical protein Tco_1438008 [Tanacetum coccineum]